MIKKAIILSLVLLILIGCTSTPSNENQVISYQVVSHDNIDTQNSENVPVSEKNDDPMTEKFEETCPYECCVSTDYKDKLCGTGEYCNNGECEKYECIASIDCSQDEYCSNYRCLKVSCESCQVVNNHQCIDAECCESNNCPNGESCVDGSCETSCEKYSTNFSDTPQSREESANSNALKTVLEDNGYKVWQTNYIRIDESTSESEIDDSDAGLINSEEAMPFNHQSARINIKCDKNIDAVNGLLIQFKNSYADYYTIKVKDESSEEITTFTSTRSNLDKLTNGEIDDEEFLNMVLSETHRYTSEPNFPNKINWS